MSNEMNNHASHGWSDKDPERYKIGYVATSHEDLNSKSHKSLPFAESIPDDQKLGKSSTDYKKPAQVSPALTLKDGRYYGLTVTVSDVIPSHACRYVIDGVQVSL